MGISIRKKCFLRSIIMIINLGLLIGLTCACISKQNQANELMDDAGNVKIISDGIESTLIGNPIYFLKDGTFGDAERKHVEDVVDGLTSINYSEDFKIIIGGKGKAGGFTLFNEKLEEVYSRKNEFTVPQENGEYIVYFEASWGNDKEYVGYQYFFKFIK